MALMTRGRSPMIWLATLAGVPDRAGNRTRCTRSPLIDEANDADRVRRIADHHFFTRAVMTSMTDPSPLKRRRHRTVARRREISKRRDRA